MPNSASIARKVQFRRRTLFVLLLLAITLFAQSQALISEHQHHSTEHCCLMCHVGLPFLQASAPATVTPATATQWLAAAPRVEFFYDVFLATTLSRGPPTQS